jgi:hypothetical protein
VREAQVSSSDILRRNMSRFATRARARHAIFMAQLEPGCMMTKSILLACLLAAPLAAAAQAVPLSYQADPSVYKLLSENEQFRVILATWKPGQKDIAHSHSAAVAYRLTDCKARVYGADGKVEREGEGKSGTAVIQGPVAAHSLENIGTAECQILIVERK